MRDLEDTPRPATGDPAPSGPAPDGDDRSLRQRIAVRWNRPGFTGKASVVLGAATALATAVGGIYVLARLSDDKDEDDLVDEVAGLLSLAPVEHDTAPAKAAVPDVAEGQELATAGQDTTAPRYVTECWESQEYWRNTCLNPDLHPDGCAHEDRLVASSTKHRSKDLLDEAA